MADTKISALPEVVTPAGTDVLPIVASGVNKKITVQNLAVQGPAGPAGPKGDIGTTGATGDTGAAGPVGLVWRGTYDNGTNYAVRDAVEYNGSAYYCTAPALGNLPTDGIHWSLLAEKGDTGAAGAAGQGFVWHGDYDNLHAYIPYDVVEYESATYICILNSTGNLPTDPTYWDEFVAAVSGGGSGPHDILSDTHTDSTAAAVQRGDIIIGSGITPTWARLGAGGEGQVLTMGPDEPAWEDAAGGAEIDPIFALTKRYGFVDNTETTIALVAVGDGTYEFTLGCVGATFRYFRNGVLCTITGDQTVLLAGTNPPTEGAHHIYFDSEDGTLVDGGAWTLLDTKVPVAHITFKGALTPKFWMSDERHTCLIDRRYHYAEHVTEGTKLAAGGSITGYTKNGTTNNENTFGIADVVLIDEDLIFNLDDLADPNADESAYVLMYRTGASTWTWAASTRPFRWTTSGYIQWDNGGTMTQGIANRFYNWYLLFSNIGGAGRFILIPGRGQFSTLAGAQAEIIEDFTFTGLDIDEFVIAYRFTWHTSASLGTDGKVELEDDPEPIDISGSHIAVGGGATDHNTLANLQGGAEAEYYHITSARHLGEWAAMGLGAAVESGSKLKVAGHAYIVQYDAGVGGAVKSLDWQNGNEQILELTADCDLTLLNGKAGGRYVIRFAQDGTGGWTIAWPVNVVWSGNIAATINPDPGALSLVALYFDGTDYIAAGASSAAAAQGMPEVPLAVLHGGTGHSAIASGEVMVGGDTNAIIRIAAPTADGQLLTADLVEPGLMKWSSSPLSRATCGVYLGTDTTASDYSEVPIEFDETSWDDFNMHDPLSNPERVTVPTGYAGVYVVTAGIGWEGNVAIGGEYYTRLYLNGTLVREVADVYTYIVTGQTIATSNLAAIIKLEEGDYLELRAYKAVGQTVALYGGEMRTYLHVAQVS